MKLHEIEFVMELTKVVPSARACEIEKLLKLSQ